MNIFQAAKLGNLKELKKLISDGINVNEKDTDGWTAFHFAVCMEFSDCVKELIKAGADINAQTEGGYTAMDFAERIGSTECIAILEQAQRDLKP